MAITTDSNGNCIQCGQAPGPAYTGFPHDHVCADCGQEKRPTNKSHAVVYAMMTFKDLEEKYGCN